MKLMIASDIHGSGYYCNKLLNAFNENNVDKLLLLGDILYHGPRNDLPKDYNPKKVIEILNSIKENIICVRGNCDSEVDQMVLEFPIMSDYTILNINDRLIFATHGHIFNEENPPILNNGDILLNGHTHIPKVTEHGYIYMNPGSVSIPKDNSCNSYMIMDKKKVIWKDFDGNSYKIYNL